VGLTRPSTNHLLLLMGGVSADISLKKVRAFGAIDSAANVLSESLSIVEYSFFMVLRCFNNAVSVA